MLFSSAIQLASFMQLTFVYVLFWVNLYVFFKYTCSCMLPPWNKARDYIKLPQALSRLKNTLTLNNVRSAFESSIAIFIDTTSHVLAANKHIAKIVKRNYSTVFLNHISVGINDDIRGNVASCKPHSILFSISVYVRK